MRWYQIIQSDFGKIYPLIALWIFCFLSSQIIVHLIAKRIKSKQQEIERKKEIERQEDERKKEIERHKQLYNELPQNHKNFLRNAVSCNKIEWDWRDLWIYYGSVRYNVWNYRNLRDCDSGQDYQIVFKNVELLRRNKIMTSTVFRQSYSINEDFFATIKNLIDNEEL
ncbi:MAG: hypothetical protein LBP59_10335 [Planctomycetaceae bacterium]|nr:hypothetical protein [Planctomycetaceae bacterium]